MKTRKVVIELLPTSVTIAHLDGARVVAFRQLDVRFPTEPAEWVKELARFATPVGECIREFNAKGLPATVLYRSPTQAVDLVSLALGSRSEACAAAKLGIFDAVQYSPTSAVCEAVVVGRDRTRGDGQSRQYHIVVAADREDIANAIVQLVEAAGLRFACATPCDAIVLAKLAESSLQCAANTGNEIATLYIGDYNSHFLYASNGSLCFSRKVNLGVRSMAEVLARPFRCERRSGAGNSAVDDSMVRLSECEALAILHKHGLVNRTAKVHEELGLHCYDLLPLIQPMLQRSIVELRQSLRFGVPDEAREGITITCTGPGSSVPGLAELIATEIEVSVVRDGANDTGDNTESGAVDSPLHFDASDAKFCEEMNLQPVPMAQSRRVSRLKRWMWTGAAAAIAVIAFDAVRFTARAAEARRTADALTSRAASDEALRATAKRLMTSMEHMKQLDQLIEQEIGARVDFRAALHELSRITPRSVRYTNVSFRRSQGVMTGSLSGFAVQASNELQSTELRSLVEALRESPLFANVVLGSVQFTSLGDRSGEQFETSLHALAARANATPTNVAYVREENVP